MADGHGKGPNFTPPSPAYPLGHAVFGAELFQTPRRFYGSDRIAFTFVSDEFNGMARDNTGQVRALRYPLGLRLCAGHRAGPGRG
jgi:hypothetical protein